MTLSFYASLPHECSYIPGQTATSIFADPTINMTNTIYGKLAEIGFRRSGKHVYAPNCGNCHACVPLRIPVNSFKPNRQQRRTLSRNKDVIVSSTPAQFNPLHFELYRRYISQRHSGGGMDNPTPDSYMDFLTSPWSDTAFYELRLDHQLIAVSVVDHLPRALSAVYSFFDPDYSYLSPGNFAILWLIDTAESRQLDWLYLGYWIKDCRKMAYKDHYRPIEALVRGRWQRYHSGDPIPASTS